jgi:Holliday junction resolvase-like predicted endonuclease
MRDTILNHPWLLPALLALGIIFGVWLGSRVRRFWMRRRLARQWRRARRGEEHARGWLERNGFTVLDEQVNQPAFLIVNGEESPFTVRADYLVERNGVRAVVEVKTGAVADPSSRGTRRQILEYAWVYGVSEVYLFDADAQQLHRIGVPSNQGAATPARFTAWQILLALFLGVALGALGALGALAVQGR